ncbi:hypothetical protein MNQ98_06640 [Paenibacillus sp. N3/727]|uniref:hypothetical protein n=1 Tax=Paenibacillus sp. N3/727 TaxID=2925845 RepID=UPI001F531F4E|nr:hypothetical protein [Paenibacillus sp. N3/727]UNK19703.1 hypothetical protein MNQ98_06640 [Paenibacillus sp. N3/727]
MLKKAGMMILSVLVLGMVTVYLDNSLTAKRVMEAVEENFSDEKSKKQEKATRPWLTEDECINFLGKPALISMNGSVLLSHEAIEIASKRILKRLTDVNQFEIFGSSTNSYQFLAVYDVTETLPATVNQHLGNHVIHNIMGPDFENIQLDLKGYSLFMSYFKSTDGSFQKIMEARWVPTELRESELQYERYEKQMDLRIKPDASDDNEYLNDAVRSDMEQQFREQRLERRYKARDQYLLQDSNGKTAVIPFKE